MINGPVTINLVQWRDEFGQPHTRPSPFVDAVNAAFQEHYIEPRRGRDDDVQEHSLAAGNIQFLHASIDRNGQIGIAYRLRQDDRIEVPSYDPLPPGTPISGRRFDIIRRDAMEAER